MKTKTLALVLSTIFTVSANAAEPQVSCEIMYNKSNSAGISVEFRRGIDIPVSTNDASGSTNGGFVMNATLKQICAVSARAKGEGGALPCSDDYLLTVTISKEGAQSLLNAIVRSVSKNERYSSALKIGDETGFVNCDARSRL